MFCQLLKAKDYTISASKSRSIEPFEFLRSSYPILTEEIFSHARHVHRNPQCLSAPRCDLGLWPSVQLIGL